MGEALDRSDGLTNDPDAWQITDPAHYVLAMSNAIKLSYYQALVPLEYQLVEAQAAPAADLNKWCVWYSDGIGCLRYADKYQYPSSAYSFAVRAPYLGFKDAHDNILAGTALLEPKPVDAFPVKLMNDMQDAGLYTPYLFLRWPLKRDLCAAAQWRGISVSPPVCP